MKERPGERTGRDASRPSRASDDPFDEDVDDASEASFPASDPPAWMGLRVGGPSSRRQEPERPKGDGRGHTDV